MADILRITTPLVDKNPIQPNKQVADPSIPFNLSDVTRVAKPGQQSEILKQNNGMVQEEKTASILMNMLKDPSVTVGFLKNIFMLQEIIQLLPVNNLAMTQELQQMFDALLVQPDGIVAELAQQENASTSFKGELFDFLRSLLAQKGGTPEVRYGVTNLLKSLNAQFYQGDILRSLSNSMSFLADSVAADKALAQTFASLAEQFRAPDAKAHFSQLRDAVLGALHDLEGSILYSPKLQKTAPMVVYNLSRFNDNADFLREALHNLITLVDGDAQRMELLRLVDARVAQGKAGQEVQPWGEEGKNQRSQVMDTLAKLIGRQAQSEDLNMVNAEKLDRIVHSLLSSPCNFTPLLHFILPVQDDMMKSFAEIWIDQDGERENEGRSEGDRQIHVLVVFDVEGIGQLEAELYLKNQSISLHLFCPPAYVDAFSGIGRAMAGSLDTTEYRFEEITVDKMERQRSLMDVFKTLPHKRTGINVTV